VLFDAAGETTGRAAPRKILQDFLARNVALLALGEECSMASRENSDKSRSYPKEQHGKRPRAPDPSETEQLIFTVSSATGSILRVEKANSHGERHEIDEDATTALVGKHELREIEMVLDEALEAGITCVLEPTARDDSHEISEEEVELRRELLTGLIGQGTRRRLRHRLVKRLILAKALAHRDER